MKAACFEFSSGHAVSVDDPCRGLNCMLRLVDSGRRHFLVVPPGVMLRAAVLIVAALLLGIACSSAMAQPQPRAPGDIGPSRPPPVVDRAPIPLPSAPGVIRPRAVAQTIYQYSPFFLRLGTAVQQGFDRTPVPEWSWGDGSPDSFGRTAKIWQQPGTFYGRVTGFRGGVRFQQTFRTEVVQNPIDLGAVSCAIRADKQVMCWGYNQSGQVGDGTRTDALTPQRVIGVTDVIGLAVASHQVCALKADRTVVCWGGFIATVDGVATYQLVPKTVAGLSDVRSIAGSSSHFCVVKGDTTVVCWGSNQYDAVGVGIGLAPIPTPVVGVTGAVALALGPTRSCALKVDGTAVCWGGDPIAMPTPDMTPAETAAAVALKAVTGLTGGVAISGDINICFLKMDGTVHCRGYNSRDGDLGEPFKMFRRDVVAPVPGVSGIAALATQSNFPCTLKANGTALCWGDNSNGQIDPASTESILAPTVIPGLSGVAALSTYGRNACALKTSGSLFCWGENYSGQLGTGTLGPRSPPVPVAGGAVFWK